MLWNWRKGNTYDGEDSAVGQPYFGVYSKAYPLPVLDKVMPKITLLGNGGLIWLVVTAVFLARKQNGPYGFMLMVALVLCLAVEISP